MIGLLGFFLLQIFQNSLMNQSLDQARAALGGDITITARRTITEEELLKIEKVLQFTAKSHQRILFSMLRHQQDSNLTQVLVVDDQYPLYGKVKLSNQPLVSDRPYVWTDPDIIENQRLQIPSQVQIGDKEFTLVGAIVEDSSRLLRIGALASRVIIHEKYLPDTQLIQTGTTFTDSWSYQLSSAEAPMSVKKTIETLITDPTIRVSAVGEGGEGTTQVLKYFTDYLGLVALVALGLCLLCGSYLMLWVFETRKRNIAIYKALGIQDLDIMWIYLLQTLTLAFFCCLISYILILGFFPLLQQLIIQQFGLNINLQINSIVLVIATACGVLAPLFMSLPQLINIFDMSPNEIFQNQKPSRKNTVLFWAWVMLSVLVFWSLSIWQSHSYTVATLFVFAVAIVFAIFNGLNFLIFNFLEAIASKFSWQTQYAIKSLSRKIGSTRLVFTTMGVAVLVLSLLPHIKSSILYEVRPHTDAQIPYLFLFDIQPEQVSGLQNIAEKELSYQLNLSPLVRSRILKINDSPYERIQVNNESFRTREEEEEARFRNRGVNLTYREFLQESETNVEGSFIGKYEPKSAAEELNQLPAISLEKKYAERVGVKLGDTMTFDVQGIEVKAKVSSFRQVRWTSFQPNFFIVFPMGVLEEAPQMFLSSVPQFKPEQVKSFQRQVTGNFKNISVIDINQTVQQSLVYIDQMSLALQMMAWFAILVGLLIFIILLNTQIRERISEFNLLQILGADDRMITKTLFMQFFFLISITIVIGAALALILVRVIIAMLFKISVVYDWVYLGSFLITLLPIIMLTLYWGIRPLKKLNPMDLIRQN